MIAEYLANLLNEFEKLKVRGLFSFLVNYPQTLIRATNVALVANTEIYATKNDSIVQYVAKLNKLEDVIREFNEHLKSTV